MILNLFEIFFLKVVEEDYLSRDLVGRVLKNDLYLLIPFEDIPNSFIYRTSQIDYLIGNSLLPISLEINLPQRK